MASGPPERVGSLDLIRGVAVLGILAINIAGFAGPPAAVLSPNYPAPASPVDMAAFAFTFVLFEGKMRALFCILFGASLALFLERAEAAGQDSDLRQLRRLLWLAVFGLAHFYLLWWGDILFAYALTGIAVLMMRELSSRALAVAAAAIFLVSHLAGGAMELPGVIAEERVRAGTASTAQHAETARYHALAERKAIADSADIDEGFVDQARRKLTHRPLRPLIAVIDNIGETLPLMLLGVLLFRIGLFTGGIPLVRLRRLALWSTLAGLTATLALLGWVWPRGFPIRAMNAIMAYWTAIPHLLMALGYAALLALAAPRLAATGIGTALTGAGRMAFTNYIGTSLMMTAIFCGWGLGLTGTYGHAALMGFVLAGWLAMMAASGLWLARFRRGPLEWAWRSLVERRLLANVR